MQENVCVVNHYCKLENKKKENQNQREKKKHVKHVIKGDQLIYFGLTISSFCGTDDPFMASFNRWDAPVSRLESLQRCSLLLPLSPHGFLVHF